MDNDMERVDDGVDEVSTRLDHKEMSVELYK